MVKANLDEIYERHQEAVWEDYTTKPPTLMHTGECVADGKSWPCDTQVMRMEAFDANADAEQLAEALYGLVETLESLPVSSSYAMQDAARDALKAHEERQR